MCAEQLGAWHMAIQADKTISHLTDLETDAQEATGPGPHIKFTMDPEREETGAGLGVCWGLGTADAPFPVPSFCAYRARLGTKNGTGH